MRENGAPRRCVAAMALLLTAAAALGGCEKKTPADLVLISPHNKKIQGEFTQAFRAWHQAKFGADAKLEWRDLGGTSSCTKYILNVYKSSETRNMDLYFGGGAPDHIKIAEAGCSAPVTLPKATMDQLPETIGGVRQYDAEGRWHAAAVSCFGIFYHARLLKEKSLPLPETWDVLADPRMKGWVGAADASQSGSAKASYEMIVQSAPDWPAGWAKLLAIFANCKHFTSGASDLINDVANGEVLAGTAIDFYAYDPISRDEKGELGFAVVPGSTAFTPDPISMLKGAPHQEMAQRFIEFVLSAEGQKLWCLPVGAEGGPKAAALYRQPIRRDVYETCKDTMLKPLVNPFELAGKFRYDEASARIRIGKLYGPLMKAAVLNSKTQLAEAWAAALASSNRQALLKELTALPENLADSAAVAATAGKLADAKQAEAVTREWQQFFRAKYEKVAADAGKAP